MPVLIQDRRNRASRFWIGFAVLVVLTLCSGWCALPVAAQSWLPHARLPNAYVVKACASLRLTGSVRVAAWWGSPLSTRTGQPLKPFVESNMACGYMLWAPFLPTRGEVESSR